MYGTPIGQTPNFERISYAEVLSRPHRAATLAQIEAPDGTVLAQGIGVDGGEVRVDSTAQFRRACDLNLVPYGGSGIVGVTPQDVVGLDSDEIQALRESLIPERAGDPTSPYGNMVRIWRGLVVPGYGPVWGNGTFLWQLGLFRLSSAEVDDDGVPSLKVSGYDRSRTVSRNKLTQPWILTPGTNWGDAIVALVQDRNPGAPARAHLIEDTVTGLVTIDPEQDPWEVVSEWAKAIGCEVFFDNEGYLVIRPEPDPSTSPIVWEYSDGTVGANATILGVGRSMTDEPGYNGVVLTSESTTLPAPIRSEVWDLNPSSPTYAEGAYGRVPKFVSNPYVGTQGQGDAAATAELLRSLGGTERVTLACVPNPAHEAGDVIRVRRPLSKIDHVGVVESFNIPLDASTPMTITCKERRALA